MKRAEFTHEALTAVLLIAVLSVIMTIFIAVNAQPGPIESIKISNGMASYYASVLPSASPGLIIRVYTINGSRVYPIPTFITVYGLTPGHVVPITYGFGPVIYVPFSNANWRFIISRWVSFNSDVNKYNTSLLIFITYIDFTRNESWLVAFSVPYSVNWVMGRGDIRYIVLTAYVNLSAKPFRLIPIKRLSTNQLTNSLRADSAYTEYNCLEQGPIVAELGNGPQMYKPVLYCYGFIGPIPLIWITWSKGIVREYEDYGIELALNIMYLGVFDWDAVSYENGMLSTIGTSYSAYMSWNVPIVTVDLGFGYNSYLAQPGSFYFAYNGSLALINYTEYYYVDHVSYVYAGSTAISEVLNASSSNSLIGNLDYGNGPVSYIYNTLIPLAEQEFRYPALSKLTIITYASWKNGTQGPGCGTLRAYPAGTAYYWLITLQNMTTAYYIGPAQPYALLDAVGINALSTLNTMEPSPAYTSLMYIKFVIMARINNLNKTSWYLSLINLRILGIPALGFIINATSYYQNSGNSLSCEG
ncbi:hypothetical protein [Vulcanisaeta sp. JCM 14467]